MHAEDGSGTEDSSSLHLERAAESRVPHAHGGSGAEGSIRVPIPVAAASVAFTTALIIALVALSVGKYNCPGLPELAAPADHQDSPCSPEWVAHQRKCYLVSTTREPWPSARSSCSKDGAALAVLDSPKDLTFLQRYAGSAPHWIELKNHAGQKWRGPNGKEVINRFNRTESERCAFLNSTDVGQMDCQERLPWICSKDIR
ncbi:PREDICTED: early activation antigen CD69 [Dipodomys ordii]|uniref:Early activation antigen CD69 n=1 Tax=Dipodomys ordii TaxID=10020 RepID=A0A1S3FWZ5_DIPOR|nr:PREDICTED: early activation antigen CD69 [Dipodomys ordii]